MNSEPEILFERRGAAGLVTLNRPKALNAVTLGMVRALTKQLLAWASDSAVGRVVVTAAGERAFCAGGDIRALYELGRAERFDEALTFWREEYQLNAIIKNYPKPYISLIDGIVMGGGFGISAHGSHLVAGDRYQFAMPEVSIGFFPDVGATFVLPRLPGQVGAWIALTGERLNGGDAARAGLATQRVPSGRFAELLQQLQGDEPVDEVLGVFAEPPGAGPLTVHRATIDQAFAGDTVEEIIEALDRIEADAEWAGATAASIRTKSPTSLRIALAQVRGGVNLSFEDCMKTEFRIVSRIVHGHDFYEGVRAVLIDKDNAPHWKPAHLADVGAAEIERHFAPLGADELVLPNLVQ